MNYPQSADLSFLYYTLQSRFNFDELIELTTMGLQLDHETYPRDVKYRFCLDLLLDMERRGRLRSLIGAMHERRPDPSLADLLERLPDDRSELKEVEYRKPEERLEDDLLLHLGEREKTLVPFQAPPQSGGFLVGRLVEQEQIKQALLRRYRPLCVLSGMGGVGKSMLALHMVYRLRHHFRDGVLWIRLPPPIAGETTESRLMPILADIAAAYGREFREEADFTSRQRVVREVLAYKQALLVLDNLNTVQDLEALLPPDGPCATLVTTRNHSATLEGTTHVRLHPFDAAEGEAFLRSVLGDTRASAAARVTQTLVALVGGLPLALRLIASALVETPFLSIEEYHTLLVDETVRLSHLQDWQDASRSVHASFRLSYDLLSAPLQEMFAALSLFAGPDFSVEAVATLLAISPVQAKLSLGRLVALSLIEPSSISLDTATALAEQPRMGAVLERYRIHDLLKLFAGEQLSSSPMLLRERLAHYYASLIETNVRYGYALLDLEWQHTIPLLSWAAGHARWEVVLRGVAGLTQGSLGIVGFMDARGYWHEAARLLALAVQGTEVLQDELRRAVFLGRLGVMALRQTDFDAAHRHLHASEAILRSLPPSPEGHLYWAELCGYFASLEQRRDPQSARGWLEAGLTELEGLEGEPARHQYGYLSILTALLLARSGQLQAARETAEHGLSLLPAEPTAARVTGLIVLGNISDLQGELAQSLRYQEEGIRVVQALGDARRLAMLWGNRAGVEGNQGQFSQALMSYDKALQLYQHLGAIEGIVQTHINLAVFALALGEDERALANLEQALATIQAHQGETYRLLSADAFAQSYLAVIRIHQGQLEMARQGLAGVEAQAEQAELPHLLALIYYWQAEILRQERRHDEALTQIDISLAQVAQGGYALEEGMAYSLRGSILDEMGHFAEATLAHQRGIAMIQGYPLESTQGQFALVRHRWLSGQETAQAVSVSLREVLLNFERLGATRDVAAVRAFLAELGTTL